MLSPVMLCISFPLLTNSHELRKNPALWDPLVLVEPPQNRDADKDCILRPLEMHSFQHHSVACRLWSMPLYG